MQVAVEHAKGQLAYAKQRMEHAFANIPEDRLCWSPSPTARTPVQIVVHAADAVTNIQSQLNGTPFHIPTTAEADAHFLHMEKEFSTREDALRLLDERCSGYVEWLDAMTPEIFNGTMPLPFGLGAMPVSMALDVPAGHMNGHTGQLEYIQTILGDRDWHL